MIVTSSKSSHSGSGIWILGLGTIESIFLLAISDQANFLRQSQNATFGPIDEVFKNEITGRREPELFGAETQAASLPPLQPSARNEAVNRCWCSVEFWFIYSSSALPLDLSLCLWLSGTDRDLEPALVLASPSRGNIPRPYRYIVVHSGSAGWRH
jgi:hypothetical protein